MGHIYTSVDQLIGGTPLLELSRLEREEGLEARILAKLECFNPAGSTKDRAARAMLDDAEARGLLRPGSVVIEPPGIQALVWPLWRQPGATGSSSSCRRP